MNFIAMTANGMLSRHLSDVWETGLVDFHLVNSGGGGSGEEYKGGGGEIGGEKGGGGRGEEEEGEGRRGRERGRGRRRIKHANKVPFA